MNTVSHRELRNNSAEILRAVAGGESYAVTNHGVTVARISPAGSEPDLRCARTSQSRPRYASLPRVRASAPTAAMLDDLRSER